MQKIIWAHLFWQYYFKREMAKPAITKHDKKMKTIEKRKHDKKMKKDAKRDNFIHPAPR